MKKICFIVPYFGKLPNYFQLFLQSCKYNPDYTWLIFTDDETSYNYPSNVTKISMTFEKLKDIISNKFEFQVALDTPYKLCDFKPTYGYIFEDYLNDYKFWGHCDIDTIMGNLNHFLTDDFLEKYDKIFALGHMTIYKNTYENNRVFMKEYKGRSLYQEYLTDPQNRIFDEDCLNEYNIHNIFKNHNKKVFEGDFSLNLYYNNLKFIRTYYVGLNNAPKSHGHLIEKYRKALYLWKNGNIVRFFAYKKQLKAEQFLYIHFQGRKMTIMLKSAETNTIRISPNLFTCFNNNISLAFVSKCKPIVAYRGLLREACVYSLRNMKVIKSKLIDKLRNR